MNNKTNYTTSKLKDDNSMPVFKTRMDAVCYSQARMMKALKDMQKALAIIDGPLKTDECKFKLFISLAYINEDFPKAKRFIIFVDPVNEEPNLKEIREAAAYVRKHQLGRIRIRNDFNHEITITAYTAYKLDETHQLLKVLKYILIDELEKAHEILDLIVGGRTTPISSSTFDPTFGCINLVWTRK